MLGLSQGVSISSGFFYVVRKPTCGKFEVKVIGAWLRQAVA
jgi:hypothetical protein